MTDPTNDFTFDSHTWEGEELTLHSAVFQALGAASMCWEHVHRAGVFESDRAKIIGDTLVSWIEEYYARQHPASGGDKDPIYTRTVGGPPLRPSDQA